MTPTTSYTEASRMAPRTKHGSRTGPGSSRPQPPEHRSSRTSTLVGALLALGLCVAGVVVWRSTTASDKRVTPASTQALNFVGTTTCRSCHADAAADWNRSQHAAAMAEATDATVLGRFDGATFTKGGVTSTFFKRDGRFFVRTDGADGQLADFEVAYTFGVSPLQQYLVRFPGGRMQALSIAWDSRPEAAGGQRWFHLYADESITHDDPLHWTGLHQNWNFMCADCHSTNLRKGYDVATREFSTTWSEISVGCESCHGPGSRHVELANDNRVSASETGLTATLDERAGVTWRFDLSAMKPVRSASRTTNREIEVCARCHSRRSQITDNWHAGQPFENGFRANTLEPLLYYPDGQQRDEVYTTGSFLQSRMHAAGVTCSDCHNPHSGKLKLPGNATCTQCHQSPTYDSADHHFHAPGSAAAACTSCHMPTTTYMVVDPRHDHSFRIPRPDLTVTSGVPNACSTCHTREGAAWAASQLERRRGRTPQGFQRFAAVFDAADRGTPVATDLARLATDAAQPDIVRAAALSRLSTTGAPPFLPLDSLAAHDDPMIRRMALGLVTGAEPGVRIRLAAPLLSDPVRSVRSEAARLLADVADRGLPPTYATAFEHAFQELIDEYRFNGDRPEGQVSLGSLMMSRGRLADSETAFREAIHLDRTFAPAYVNLAEVYRLQGNEARAERTLRDALTLQPDDAGLHHALGLSLVRQKQVNDAIVSLRRAAQLAPEIVRYTYVLAVALNDTGRPSEALTLLRQAHTRHPADADIVYLLALYSDRAGLAADARRYTDVLERLQPGHPSLPDLRARTQMAQ